MDYIHSYLCKLVSSLLYEFGLRPDMGTWSNLAADQVPHNNSDEIRCNRHWLVEAVRTHTCVGLTRSMAQRTHQHRQLSRRRNL